MDEATQPNAQSSAHPGEILPQPSLAGAQLVVRLPQLVTCFPQAVALCLHLSTNMQRRTVRDA